MMMLMNITQLTLIGHSSVANEIAGYQVDTNILLHTFSDGSRAFTATSVATTLFVTMTISIITTFIHTHTHVIYWSMRTDTWFSYGQTHTHNSELSWQQ